MSVFDKISDANAVRKQKSQELAAERGKPFLLGLCDYIGGYGDYKETKNGTIGIYENRVEFTATFSTKFHIDISEVSDIIIEGRDELSRRVTATRLVAFGVFAFAMKKKTKDQEAYVSFVLNNGEQVAFRFNKSAPISLRTKLAPLIAKVK